VPDGSPAPREKASKRAIARPVCPTLTAPLQPGLASVWPFVYGSDSFWFNGKTMRIAIAEHAELLGRQAANTAARALQEAIAARGEANLIVATGTSQFEMLAHLVQADIDWNKVTGFHLDEYIGMDASHPASFRKYLRERFVDKVAGLNAFHYVTGEADPYTECRRLGACLQSVHIDVACVGIGENGHLAFNDPPADFETEEPFLVVDLDEACRRQQLGEGWFASLDDVPKRAISMSIRQIMKSAVIVCSVPHACKAEAVCNAVEGPVTNRVPASILQQHADCHLFLDRASARLLSENPAP
jgi:glucosamine-6-phosphate deaminase